VSLGNGVGTDSIATPGCACWSASSNVAKAAGSSGATTPTPSGTASRSVVSAAPVAARPAVCAVCMSCGANWIKRRPAGVRPVKPPESRSISGTPTLDSSRWIRLVRAETEIPSCSAARPKWRQSATAMKLWTAVRSRCITRSSRPRVSPPRLAVISRAACAVWHAIVADSVSCGPSGAAAPLTLARSCRGSRSQRDSRRAASYHRV